MAAGDAGAAITKAVINDAAFQVSSAMRNAMNAAKNFQAFLDGVSDTTLTTTYGYSTDGKDDLKSAVAKLGLVADIYNGSATLATAENFDVFPARLRGTRVGD